MVLGLQSLLEGMVLAVFARMPGPFGAHAGRLGVLVRLLARRRVEEHAVALAALAHLVEAMRLDQVVRLFAGTAADAALSLALVVGNQQAFPGFLAAIVGALLRLGLLAGASRLLLLHVLLAILVQRHGLFVGIDPGWRIAGKGRVVVGGQVEVANHVLAFELDVHRPGGEVHLALDFAGDDALLRRPPRLVAVAGLVVALVLQHHLLAGDANGPGAFGGVLGQAGIGVGDRYPQRRRRRLRRGEADIREGRDGLAARRLAGDLHVVGVHLVGHQAALTRR